MNKWLYFGSAALFGAILFLGINQTAVPPFVLAILFAIIMLLAGRLIKWLRTRKSQNE